MSDWLGGGWEDNPNLDRAIRPVELVGTGTERVMSDQRMCDGMLRRDWLRAGMLGLTGLSLSNALRFEASAAEAATGGRTLKSAIFIDLAGGPSHLDTFDLKPDAPSEVRGTFNPIATNVPGIQISEHLPKLAQCADRYAILRGVSHTLAAHQLGSEYVNTGNRPLASLEYPSYGSVVSCESELDNPADLPPFVSIPNGNQQAGFLGVRYAPMSTNAVPRIGQPFTVRGVSLGQGLSLNELGRRRNLLRDLDQGLSDFERQPQLLEGLDRFGEQAFDILTSPKAREAFNIAQESPAFAQPFGEEPFGASCLLSIRLIEAGVRFVSMRLGGWDTHQDNFTRLSTNLLPTLDTGLSALLLGLEQRGLLESTAVFVTGEFGRTPKINQRSAEGGRDHYPRCMFMLMAGGDVKGGQVIGESDDTAAGPAKHEAITPEQAAASFYHNIGVDFTKEYHTERCPITIVRDGRLLRELF
ncbi:MAG: DUF1501 domain-containing protein [Pirellulaceae bacterium]